MALNEYSRLIIQAAQKAGQCFTASDAYGITTVQPTQLKRAGFVHIDQKAYTINYSACLPAYNHMCDNFSSMLYNMQPFLIRQQVTNQEDIRKLYRQALNDMESDDFWGTAYFASTWGKKPFYQKVRERP